MVEETHSRWSCLNIREKIGVICLVILPWNQLLYIEGSVGPFDVILFLLFFLFLGYFLSSFIWWSTKAGWPFIALVVAIISMCLMIPFWDIDINNVIKGTFPIIYGFILLPLFARVFYTKNSFILFNKVNIFYLYFLVVSYLLYYTIHFPLVIFDGYMRYNSILVGVTPICVIAFAWSCENFIQNRINLFKIGFIFLCVCVVVFSTQQRSLFGGIVLMLVVSLIIKRKMKIILIFGALIAIALAIFISIRGGVDHTRILNLHSLSNASGRTPIIAKLFSDFAKEPFRIITGWGENGWAYIFHITVNNKVFTALQPPHSAFLDFWAKFGIIAAVGLFSFFMLPIRNYFKKTRYHYYYLLIILGLLPYFVVQTYPAVRGFLFPLIMISYFSILHYQENMGFKKFTKKEH